MRLQAINSSLINGKTLFEFLMHAETFHREVLEVSVWMSAVLLRV